MLYGVKSLIWIKNLYKFETSFEPDRRSKVLASVLSLSLSLYICAYKHNAIPIIINVIVIYLSFSARFSKPFFQFINLFLFFIFQSLSLILLTALFYLLITPMAFLLKVRSKNNSFYKKSNSETIEKIGVRVIDFERQF